ncbi:MAG: CRISPR-associated protein Csx18 [Microcoleaceae cyanobacterium]
MYISQQTAKKRNLAIALMNGSITLIILLIAPLGLLAVIVNTILITLASYGTGVISDRVIYYLSQRQANSFANSHQGNQSVYPPTERQSDDIRRY